VNSLTLRVTATSFVLMVADSYDVAALSFAVPELIRNWHVDKIATGGVFSAGLFGLLVGSIVFGHIGDRWGRKNAIVLGTVLFGVVTYATGWATSLNQMLVYRFIACLGLGGAVPIAAALTNEFAPKHLRVTAVTVIFAGYAIGGTFGGVISAQLVPAYGWPIFFQLGGAVSLLLALASMLFLPESASYLESKKAHQQRAAESRSAARKAETVTRLPLVELFADRRSVMTPLLWLVYVANSITLFALVSWLPVLIEAAGLGRGVAAMALSCFFLGGAAGGLVVGFLIDRSGMKALAGSALIACPVIASLGMLSSSETLLLAAATAAGFFTIGVQNSLHGVAGSIYPTHIRANGMGWALGIGKIGAISGPFIGGLLLSMALPVAQLFWAAAVPIAVVTVTAFFLMKIYDRTVHMDGPPSVVEPTTMDAQGLVAMPGKGPAWKMAPGRSRTLKLRNSETDESVMMFEEVAPVGTVTSTHLHHDSDEVAYVLSGEITFKIADAVTVGGPGTSAFMPREVPHAWKSTGADTGRVLFLYTPGRAGKLFEEMAERAVDPTNQEEFGPFAERHGWEIVGPSPL